MVGARAVVVAGGRGVLGLAFAGRIGASRMLRIRHSRGMGVDRHGGGVW